MFNMSPWKSDYVTVNKLKLHYTRTGGDKQPIILAHGVTDDGLCWTTIAKALAPDYDLVMVDARGHGRSDAPKSGYDPASHAKDMTGLITKLNLQRPILLGHSMGAMTTLAFAGTYPDIPRAILLEDPPPWWVMNTASTEAAARRTALQAWMKGIKRKTHKELVSEQRASAPTWSSAEIERWADSKHRFSPNVIEVFNSKNDISVDWQNLLPQIKCPALLITADPAHGSLVTKDGAAALKSLIPQLKIAHIPGAGHSIRHDQLNAYLQAAQTFLARL
jgi:N-formylmaleamate deformylase